MNYLILSILCSTMIAVLMRILDSKIKNNMTMFTANYLTCGLCALYFLAANTSAPSSPGVFALFRPGSGTAALHSSPELTFALIFAVLFGLVSGVFYLLSFMLLQFNIQRNGVILASTFMKLGVLVPVLMALIFFGDVPNAMQILGFLSALAAILIINSERSSSDVPEDKTELRSSRSVFWLIVLLLVGGLTDSTANIYDKLGNPDLKNEYLLFIFVAAMLSSIIGIIRRKQHFTLADSLCGICIGIPNYFSSRFLLYSLASIPAIVAYPVYNVAVILLISLIGVLCFRERLTLRKALGLLLIICAILLSII